MAELPEPGGDQDQWGDELNQYLLTEHNADGSHAEGASVQKVQVAKGGALVAARKQVNLVDGSNVTVTVTDNPGQDRVDVTVAATGTGIPVNTIDAKGDWLLGTADNTVGKLAIGANGQMPYADSTQTTGVRWGAPPSGTGIPPSTVLAKGDMILGTASGTVSRLGVGTNGQVPIADSTQATGVRWGSVSGGTTTDARPNLIYVAASNSPTAEKNRADYLCDGTADNVEIASAITAARSAGSKVQFAPGTFNIAAYNEITGPNDVNAASIDVYYEGAGPARTIFNVASGIASGLRISQVARVHVSNMGFRLAGASHGIESVATNTSTAGYRSFWFSSFKNLEFIGDFSTHSGYAMHLESPFRSVFENIDANGIGNGIRMFSSNNAFNPGDCTMTRMFMDCVGNNRRCYSFESTVANGNLNQLSGSMLEGIISGTGGIGFYFGGTGPVNYCHFDGLNLEQADTVVHFNNAYGCSLGFNYIQLRDGASANTTQAIRFDSGAKDNWIRGVGDFYVPGTVRLISSNATNTSLPNLVEHVRVYADSGSTVTNSIGTPGAVLRKWTVAEGPGTASGVTVTPA